MYIVLITLRICFTKIRFLESFTALTQLEHPHPYHPYGWYKWVPHNALYYFTLLNYLNHSTTFFKYPYHSSKMGPTKSTIINHNVTNMCYLYFIYFFILKPP